VLVQHYHVPVLNAFPFAEGLTSALKLLDGIPETNERVTRTLSRLAAAKFLLGDHDEAGSLLHRVIGIYNRAPGKQSLDGALATMDLGEVQMEQGKLAESEINLRSSLAVITERLPTGDLHASMVKRSLGALLVRVGRHQEAEQMLTEALTGFRRASPQVPRELANCLNAIAQLHIVRHEYGPGERFLQEALSIQEKAYGFSNPSTLLSVSNLASLLVHRREFARAEPLLRRALKIGEQKLGANHPFLVRTLSDFGLLYIEQRQFAMAESVLERAQLIMEQGGPRVDPIPLNRLARVYFRARQDGSRQAIAGTHPCHAGDNAPIATGTGDRELLPGPCSCQAR
jgi:tetratricopeptide (TPR) repeat protein